MGEGTEGGVRELALGGPSPDCVVEIDEPVEARPGSIERLPPNRAYWCTYLDDWVAIKRAWALTMVADEADAIREGLRCSADTLCVTPCWGGTDLRLRVSHA